MCVVVGVSMQVCAFFNQYMMYNSSPLSHLPLQSGMCLSTSSLSLSLSLSLSSSVNDVITQCAKALFILTCQSCDTLEGARDFN